MLDAEQIAALCPGWPGDSGASTPQRRNVRRPTKASVPEPRQKAGDADT